MYSFRQLAADDVHTLLTMLVDIELDIERKASLFEHSLPQCHPEIEYACWVACMAKTPIAVAVANRQRGELALIAVARKHRRKGIGRELVRQATAWTFSHGWGEIKAVLPAKEEIAAAFFLALGWTETVATDGRCGFVNGARSSICLEEHFVVDPATQYSRLVRLQRGPTEQHPLCLLLDGEHYWRDLNAVPILNQLMDRGIIPRMTLAFVGHVSGRARQQDYVCSKRYSEFIVQAVVEWVKSEVPSVRAGGNLIGGLSLSGLMAAYLAVEYSDRFRYCLAQSGSFWWQDEWFATMVRQCPPLNGRFWLSVGDEETSEHEVHPPTGLIQSVSQVHGVRRAVDALKDSGATVQLNLFAGGHGRESWRNELSDALSWLLTEA